MVDYFRCKLFFYFIFGATILYLNSTTIKSNLSGLVSMTDEIDTLINHSIWDVIKEY